MGTLRIVLRHRRLFSVRTWVSRHCVWLRTRGVDDYYYSVGVHKRYCCADLRHRALVGVVPKTKESYDRAGPCPGV